MKTLIIIPTYNEKENIEELIGEIFKVVPSVNIMVMDDNSPDGTADIVRKIQANNSQVHLTVREKKMGLASAYITGFKWGLENGFDWFYEMDADFSHKPQYLLDFESSKPEYDFLVGSRYIKGGGVVNWPLSRRFISIGGSIYAKTILGAPLHDLTGGFNCWSREVLEAINLDTIRSEGYSFQIEMKYRAYRKGFKYKEIPIIFEDRTAGKSKMSKKIVIEAMYKVLFFRFSDFS